MSGMRRAAPPPRSCHGGCRVRRRLANLLVVLSAMLCIAAVAGWVRSRTVLDRVWTRRVTPHLAYAAWVESVHLASGDGALRLYRINSLERHLVRRKVLDWQWSRPMPADRPGFFDLRPSVTETHLSFAGFAYVSGRGLYDRHHTSNSGRVVVVPYWSVVLATAMPPALRLRATLRRRRRGRSGMCVDCGYDCRATPGRCPECGAGANAVGENAVGESKA